MKHLKLYLTILLSALSINVLAQTQNLAPENLVGKTIYATYYTATGYIKSFYGKTFVGNFYQGGKSISQTLSGENPHRSLYEYKRLNPTTAILEMSHTKGFYKGLQLSITMHFLEPNLGFFEIDQAVKEKSGSATGVFYIPSNVEKYGLRIHPPNIQKNLDQSK